MSEVSAVQDPLVHHSRVYYTDLFLIGEYT